MRRGQRTFRPDNKENGHTCYLPMLLQLYCCPTHSFPVQWSWYSKPDVLHVTVSTSGLLRVTTVPGCLSGSSHPNTAPATPKICFQSKIYSNRLSNNTVFSAILTCYIVTDPTNGPVMFCSLTSVICLPSSVVVCNAAGGRPAAERMGGQVANTARRASTVTYR